MLQLGGAATKYQKYANKGTQVDLILLCETFLNRKTIKLAKIPGYDLITNCREISKGGGTAILT